MKRGCRLKICKGFVGGDARCGLFSSLGVAGAGGVFFFVCLFVCFVVLGDG